jgi:hypothetical protein
VVWELGLDFCELRTMFRPASDYPDDVTVYLVVNDFGKFGRAAETIAIAPRGYTQCFPVRRSRRPGLSGHPIGHCRPAGGDRRASTTSRVVRSVFVKDWFVPR